MFFNINQPIKTIMFGKITEKKGFWHNGRSLSNHLLVYCTQGSVAMRVADTIYHLGEGDILIIPADTYYIPLQSEGCTYYFFHFLADCSTVSHEKLTMTKTAEHPSTKEGYSYTYSASIDRIIEVNVLTKKCNNARVYGIFERAAELTPYCNATEKLLIDALVQELLIILSTDFVHRDITNRKLQEIVDYINVNYAREISLSLLSEIFFLSQSYVARLFRDELHLTVSDYVNSVRLVNACSLLVHTDLPIGDIAESVGYASVFYFSRLFKKAYSVSPSAFRQGQSLLHE